MTRLTAMRVMTDQVKELKEWLTYSSYAENIKLAEARIDALELAVEEMQRLEDLEK